jgi:hypothetical protein
MGNNNRLIGAIVKINNSQISMAQPIESDPFTGHRLYTWHRRRISCQLFEFGKQLSLHSRIHALDIPRGTTVDHEFGHWIQNAESGLNAAVLPRLRSRRAERRSSLAFSSRSRPSASLISQNCDQEMMTSRGLPRESTTIFLRIAFMTKPYHRGLSGTMASHFTDA